MSVSEEGSPLQDIPDELIGYAAKNPDWGQEAIHNIGQNDIDGLRSQLSKAGFDISDDTLDALMRLNPGQVLDELERLKSGDVAFA